MSAQAYAVVEWIAVAVIVGAAAVFALRRWWPRRRAPAKQARTGDCGSPASAACTACNGCEMARQGRGASR